jgi:hypothetical protein
MVSRIPHDLGRSPFGFRYDDAGEHWVPDWESGDFEAALEVLEAREKGLSWRDVASETDVPKDTTRNIWDRQERYLQEAENA